MSVVWARIVHQSFINHNRFVLMIVRFVREGKDHSEETVLIYQTGNLLRKKLFSEAKQTLASDHSQHLWKELE